MIIHALDSGANDYMADFEDSHAATWLTTLQGQANLLDAVAGTICYEHPRRREVHRPHQDTATFMVRPLVEKQVRVHGQPMSASLLDLGLYFFHNARTLNRQGQWPLLLPAKVAQRPGGQIVK